VARAIPTTVKCPTFVPPAPGSESSLTVKVTSVTPMFGGGWSPGEIDQVTPISGKAIRGHLRTWWRLTCSSSELAQMDEWEAAIFGSTANASPVDVRVTADSPVRFREVGHSQNRYGLGSSATYALFPAIERKVPDPTARGGERSEPAKLATEGFEFDLTIRWLDATRFELQQQHHSESRRREDDRSRPQVCAADVRTHVLTALRAWLTFGGIGARTRRGVGAVHVNAPIQAFAALPKLHLRDAKLYLAPVTPANDPITAWQQAVQAYQSFRQGPRGPLHEKDVLTRDPMGNVRSRHLRQVSGRTSWPEPQSIRRITRAALKDKTWRLTDRDSITFRNHETPLPQHADEPCPAFPRAILGLPIGFRFADGPSPESSNCGIPNEDMDPAPMMLLPSDGRDRMTSPVITRPIFFNDRWRAGFLILRGSHLKNLKASLEESRKPRPGNPRRSYPVPHREIADDPSLSRIAVLRGRTDALDALVEFLIDRERGYVETPLEGLR
jgi:CRISPR-associated protein Cmr1